jgi:hypothetical protein
VDPAVAQPDRDLHLNLAVRGPDDRAQILADAEAISRDVEVMRDRVEARGLGRSGVRRAIGDSRRLVRVRSSADRGFWRILLSC